jgi:hypothetical protein
MFAEEKFIEPIALQVPEGVAPEACVPLLNALEKLKFDPAAVSPAA